MNDESKPLAALIEIAVKTAAAICDDTIERRPAPMEQRVAIALVQARALECRTFAGLLLINGHRYTQKFPPGPAKDAAEYLIAQLSVQQRERSKRLEDMAMQLAKQWPPRGEDFEEPSGLVM